MSCLLKCVRNILHQRAAYHSVNFIAIGPLIPEVQVIVVLHDLQVKQ